MARNRIEKRFCKFRNQKVSVVIELHEELGNEAILGEDIVRCLTKRDSCENFACIYAIEELGGEGKDPF